MEDWGELRILNWGVNALNESELKARTKRFGLRVMELVEVEPEGVEAISNGANDHRAEAKGPPKQVEYLDTSQRPAYCCLTTIFGRSSPL